MRKMQTFWRENMISCEKVYYYRKAYFAKKHNRILPKSLFRGVNFDFLNLKEIKNKAENSALKSKKPLDIKRFSLYQPCG